MKRFIDLHTHTNFSDGTKSPTELVKLAKHMGLSAIAITDHGTVKGVEEALQAGETIGLEVVPGVELDVESNTEIHILGYYIDYSSKFLNDELEKLNISRMHRNERLIERLSALGIYLSMHDVVKGSGGEIIGRLHFANAMVAKGFVKTVGEAFDKYLSPDMPAYVKKQRFLPKEGIDFIIRFGGVPVLAHPWLIDLDYDKLDILVGQLKEYGLRGIEAYYSTHTQEQTAKLLELAEKYSLIVTGGSDFHGENKKEIEIGKGFGNLSVDYELLDILKKEAKRIQGI